MATKQIILKRWKKGEKEGIRYYFADDQLDYTAKFRRSPVGSGGNILELSSPSEFFENRIFFYGGSATEIASLAEKAFHERGYGSVKVRP